MLLDVEANEGEPGLVQLRETVKDDPSKNNAGLDENLSVDVSVTSTFVETVDVGHGDFVAINNGENEFSDDREDDLMADTVDVPLPLPGDTREVVDIVDVMVELPLEESGDLETLVEEEMEAAQRGDSVALEQPVEECVTECEELDDSEAVCLTVTHGVTVEVRLSILPEGVTVRLLRDEDVAV